MADLNHLHLHVRDLERSVAFYGTWFGLERSRRFDEVQFVRGSDGFDLALVEERAPAALPAWFHVGFRLGEPEEVRDLHARMRAAGVARLGDLTDASDIVFFRVHDPDGLPIDVYWE
jgi:catechol 2,3-dioxygenase-like lactoylglutathione lyase family enzyme